MNPPILIENDHDNRRMKDIIQEVSDAVRQPEISYLLISTQTIVSVIEIIKPEPDRVSSFASAFGGRGREVLRCHSYIRKIEQFKYSRWNPKLNAIFNKKMFFGLVMEFHSKESLEENLRSYGILSAWVVHKISEQARKKGK
tara:strand:+ start:323 stop:748 length:426 start_codon:yes stop_codon:yes gene_type:complete